MKLTPAELAYVRAQGLYVTEKCDGCSKLLNQAVRYTIKDHTEVYCSAECRDRVFFGERYKPKAKNHAGVGPKCLECGGEIPEGKRKGSLYCSKRCAKRNSRRTRKVEKSGILSLQPIDSKGSLSPIISGT